MKTDKSIINGFYGKHYPNINSSASLQNDSTQLNSIIDNNNMKNENYDGHEKKRRRSSWQAKLERRRKDTNMASSMDNSLKLDLNLSSNVNVNSYNQQKRHSWWNLFVPDNLKQR